MRTRHATKAILSENNHFLPPAQGTVASIRSTGNITLRVALAAILSLAPLYPGLQAAVPEARVTTYLFNIPAQSLGDSLETVALALREKLLYSSELVDGKSAPALKGEYTTEQAIRQLLEGTGMDYKVADGLITIRPKETVSLIHALGTGEPTSTARFIRVAEVPAAASSPPATPSAGETIELDEVMITGSRLQAAGFNAPTPVTVVGAETIQQRSPANIVDVLVEQPAFQISVTDSTRNGSGGNGGNNPQVPQATLNLRGLGAPRTLLLINGRRSVGTNWDGTVDSNIIPVGLVERVDVVTGGASAAYGSDAVAGVVNIILNNKLQGIRATAQTGFTEYASAKQYTMSLAGGTSLLNDRMHVMGGIDFNKTEDITDVYGKKWAQAEIANVAPSATLRTANGLPATVISTGVEPASTAPGGLYITANGQQAYTFNSNGDPVLFSRGTVSGDNPATGQLMMGSTSNYGHNLNNINPLRLAQQRLDTMGRLSYDLTDNLNAFVEVGDSRSKLPPYRVTELQQGAGFGGAPVITIGTANPFRTAAINNVIGTGQFTIGRNHTELGRFGMDDGSIVKQDYETRRIVAGLEGSFGDGWKWDAYFQNGRTRLNQRRNDLSIVAMQKAVNGCNTSVGFTAGQITLVNRYEALSGKTCAAFNPFGVGRNSQTALDYVQNATHQIQRLELDVAAATISGSPFKVPAGEVAVAAGAEWRHESLSADSDDVSAAGTAVDGALLISSLVESFGNTSVKEMFAEVGVPLLKDMPFAQSLDFNAAMRVTDYELSGTVKTWKTGLSWEPVDSLRVRYTRSHDIRAPNLRALFFRGGPNSQTVNTTQLRVGTVGRDGTVYNPPAGTASATLNLQVPGGSGNPSLSPEIADTQTLGVVFTLGGFNASVDYYKIDMKDAIAGPNAQTTVNLCVAGEPAYCNFIKFNSAINGGIELLEPLNLNLNKQFVEGYDFEVGYRMPVGPGNFSVRGLLNYQPHNYQIAGLNIGVPIKTENSNTLGNSPKVAYNISLGYDVGRWNTNVQIRGFAQRRGSAVITNADGSYNSAMVLGPEDPGYDPTRANTINKNRWPGQYTINPSVMFRVNGNVSAFFNIDNLLDVGPPGLSFSSVYDLIGRRYRAGVRVNL